MQGERKPTDTQGHRGVHVHPNVPSSHGAVRSGSTTRVSFTAHNIPMSGSGGYRRDSGSPVYHISIVAEMVETHPQTLRMYERMGLIAPQRTRNNVRLYSDADVEQVRRIQYLTQDLGVNLAGVEVIFALLREMQKMQEEADVEEPSDDSRETGGQKSGD